MKAPVGRAEEDLAEHSCTRLVVEGKAPVGRPRKTWQNNHVLGWWWRGRRLSGGTRKFCHLAEHSCTRLVVKGKAPVGRPRKTWQNIHVLGWW